ncbi:hypothetical protein ACFL1Q_03315 [Patescibacteria group bacterium]
MRKSALTLLIYSAIITVLLLTSLNIENYLTQTRVLGTKTQADTQKFDEEVFWEEFLSENPSYIPGLIETGRTNEARQINPNYPLLFYP